MTATIETTVSLPDKLSDLITVALDDMEKVRKDNKYKFDMSSWHEPDPCFHELPDSVRHINDIPNIICNVCMAGAVMAKTLNANHRFRVLPEMYIGETENKLDAIDDFRSGCVSEAARKLDQYATGLDFISEADKYESFVDFEASMMFYRAQVEMIKNEGL